MTTIDPRYSESSQLELTSDPEGRTVVAGTVDDRDIVVARLDGDGELDSSFGDGGQVTVRLHFILRATGVVVRPDGRIMVGGTRYSDAHGYQMLAVQLQA